MELFYVNPEAIKDNVAILDDFERRHIVQTLRKKKDETIHFTDGLGYHYTGIIVQTVPELIVQIQEKTLTPVSKHCLTLACGFIKQNRLDFILEKGTELGVSHFVFFNSQYSNYFSANEARLKKIIRQALKQSLHFYFPELSFFKTFEAFLKFAEGFQSKMVAINQSFPMIREVLPQVNNSDQLLITIGPEGGFSSTEITEMLDKNFIGISLGEHRLRSETAAISAISFVKQYI